MATTAAAVRTASCDSPLRQQDRLAAPFRRELVGSVTSRSAITVPNVPLEEPPLSLRAPSRPTTASSTAVSEVVDETVYDRTTIVSHWVTAALVALLWCIGQTIDYFPKGTPRVSARSAHILLGATLGIVLVSRLLWRIRWGRRLPAASEGALGVIHQCGHVVLYGLLLATVAFGIANAWIRGDTILGLFKIPSIAPGASDLRERVENIHAWLANTLLVVVGLHAAVALLHEPVFGHVVLRRMLPSRKAR